MATARDEKVSKTSGAFDNCALHLGVAEIVRNIRNCKSDQDFSLLPPGYQAFKDAFFEYYDISADKRNLATLKSFLDKVDPRSQEMIFGLVLRDMFKKIPPLAHLANLLDEGKYPTLEATEAQVIYDQFHIQLVEYQEGAEDEFAAPITPKGLTIAEERKRDLEAKSYTKVPIYNHGLHWDKAPSNNVADEDSEITKQVQALPALANCASHYSESDLGKENAMKVIDFIKFIVVSIIMHNKKPREIEPNPDFFAQDWHREHLFSRTPEPAMSPTPSGPSTTSHLETKSPPPTTSSTESILRSPPPSGLGRAVNPMIEEKVEALLNTAENKYLNKQFGAQEQSTEVMQQAKQEFKNTKSESLKELYTDTLNIFSDNKIVQENKILNHRREQLQETLQTLEGLKRELELGTGAPDDARFAEIDASIEKQTDLKLRGNEIDPTILHVLRLDVIDEKIARTVQEQYDLQQSIAEQEKEVNTYLKPKK